MPDKDGNFKGVFIRHVPWLEKRDRRCPNCGSTDLAHTAWEEPWVAGCPDPFHRGTTETGDLGEDG